MEDCITKLLILLARCYCRLLSLPIREELAIIAASDLEEVRTSVIAILRHSGFWKKFLAFKSDSVRRCSYHLVSTLARRCVSDWCFCLLVIIISHVIVCCWSPAPSNVTPLYCCGTWCERNKETHK